MKNIIIALGLILTMASCEKEDGCGVIQQKRIHLNKHQILIDLGSGSKWRTVDSDFYNENNEAAVVCL